MQGVTGNGVATQAGPLLTIAMPTFNRSLKAQRQAAFLIEDMRGFEDEIEFLVSDNASTDDTVMALAARCPPAVGGPRVHVNSVNLGLVGNLNRIIQLATGRYLWMVGDDDRLHAGIVPVVLASLRSADRGLIFINHQAIDQQGRVAIPSALPAAPGPRDLLDVFRHSGTTMMFITACIYRSDILRDVVACDRDQRDRLSAPLHWSFACAGKGGMDVIRSIQIDNVWGDTSWKASVQLVFDVQVPRELSRCIHLGYPTHKVAGVVILYRAGRLWQAFRSQVSKLRVRISGPRPG
jgi:abequosyltransferase